MSLMRAVIVIGQLGRIWSTTSRTRNIFQSVAVLGYYKLMEDMYGNTTQTFTIGDKTAVINNDRRQPHVEVVYKKVIFDKRPW